MTAQFRPLQVQDIPHFSEFLFTHGTNPWNYLNPLEIQAHLQGIATGQTGGLLAEEDGQLLGFVTYSLTHAFARFQPEACRDALHAQISEAVVHPDHRGKGLAPEILRRIVADLRAQGIPHIYVERHEENLASARMMTKAGFIVIETFDDPARRSTGSRRTALSKYWQS
ncbi:MAG: GNAT family N-acetyltransferase [Planctomycetales bacterium]